MASPTSGDMGWWLSFVCFSMQTCWKSWNILSQRDPQIKSWNCWRMPGIAAAGILQSFASICLKLRTLGSTLMTFQFRDKLILLKVCQCPKISFFFYSLICKWSRHPTLKEMRSLPFDPEMIGHFWSENYQYAGAEGFSLFLCVWLFRNRFNFWRKAADFLMIKCWRGNFKLDDNWLETASSSRPAISSNMASRKRAKRRISGTAHAPANW